MAKTHYLDDILPLVDEDKREELVERLREVDTRAEKIPILESYGIDIPSEGEMPSWLEESRELTDEELGHVAGGISWDRDCNCEP